jgi:hypothetical protein
MEGREQEVIDGLQLLAPIENISYLDSGDGRSLAPYARLKENREPVPLRSLGDGVVRMFDIASVLTSANEGDSNAAQESDATRVILIDEIESGLHYSIHADMWRLVLRMAKSNNLQIFATTHSLDCIRGFSEALEQEGEQGGVLRIQKGESQHFAVPYDAQSLDVAASQEIEVR